MKKEFEQYCDLLKEAEELERNIEAARKKRECVPVIHDKVQSSQKEWPYIPIHLDVEAYEPKALAKVDSKLKRLEERWKRNYEQTIEMMLRIEQEIELIPDARTRAILRARIIRQEPQKKIAIDFDLTEGRVSQIISEALEEK